MEYYISSDPQGVNKLPQYPSGEFPPETYLIVAHNGNVIHSIGNLSTVYRASSGTGWIWVVVIVLILTVPTFYYLYRKLSVERKE